MNLVFCQTSYRKFWRKGSCIYMKYKYNVSCSETTSKIWTQSAVDCYNIGCRCSKCNLYKIYFQKSVFKCKMKETVIELVRKIGAPVEYEGEGYEESI